MGILWCGGEDIDFPNGSSTVGIDGTYFRTGYARHGIYPVNGQAYVKSNPFLGGAVTSGWVTFRFTPTSTGYSNKWGVGFGLSGTNKALVVGTQEANTNKLALFNTADGFTFTQLAAESGASITGAGTLYRIDMQVTSFGATATVNVYLGGSLLFTFTGNVAVSGMTNFDSVFFGRFQTIPAYWIASEFIAADEDTRAMSLVTGAPTGAGTTDQWTGAYTDVNEATLSDATAVYTNTAAQDEQFNITDLPTGVFSIKAVKIAARSVATAGAVATTLKLGVNSAGTVNVDSGTVVGTGGQLVERLMTTNPITTAAWAQSEINALQLNLRSA